MINQIIKFIKQLAKTWCYHQEGFIQITQLLCGKMFKIILLFDTFLGLYYVCFIILGTLGIVTKNNLDKVCTSNLLLIIWSLQKISSSKKCGPLMVCAFVDLLGYFASVSSY